MNKPQESSLYVLLVEDNPGDVRLIREALAERADSSLTLECVDRLSIALQRLDTAGVDVILLDLSLPDSQGLDTFIKMHRRAFRVPIIVLSGLDNEDVAIEAVQKGAQDYLVKGQVEGYVLVRAMRYAVERKRAEENLRVANERFRLAAAAVNSVIYERDLVRDQVIWSIGLSELFGYNPQTLEPMGKWWLMHLHPDDQERVREQLTNDIAQGKDFIAEYRFLHANGHYVDVWDRGRVQRSETGEVIRMVGTMVDITARKETERLKDEFVSTVSHELRTPLATMREFTEILMDQLSGPLNSVQQEHLGIIKANVERLARIVDDMLDIAKIEAGHIILRREIIGLNPFLEQVVHSLHPLAESKQVDLRLDLPATAMPAVFADPDKLTQVLINLIGNAIKYIPLKGQVTVKVEERSNEVMFEVQDTGVGIAEADLPRLFEKFQQFRRVRGVRGAEGTGLGLAISKRLVELHGGQIWATSMIGHGSSFFFTFPKYSAEEVFHEHLRSGIEDARRRQSRFSVIVCGLANFEELKTLYEFGAVGQLLKELESLLRGVVRGKDGDVIIRWQRGEMLVILAEVDQQGAQSIANRLQHSVEGKTFSIGSHCVSVQIGTATATYPDEALTESELLALTEDRLPHSMAPKKRVLVVDDETKIRQLIKEMLELRGFSVSTAASGPEALEQLKRTPVDIILLDLTMPVMDGYEFYHILKETPQFQHIPVLIITGRGQRKDRELGLGNARYNYLDKPFEVEDLLAKIRNILQETHINKIAPESLPVKALRRASDFGSP